MESQCYDTKTLLLLQQIFRPNLTIIGLNDKNWVKRDFMRKFDYNKLVERMCDSDILNLVAKTHECKGRQDFFIRQKPVELDCLVKIAKAETKIFASYMGVRFKKTNL